MTNLIPANEYCLSIFDGTHDTPKPVTEGKLLITSKHISGGSLDTSSAYLISEKDYLSIQKRSAVSQWDILFSMIGSVGEVYLERNANIPYAIKNMGVFSCKSEREARWLYYYLISPAAKTHIQRYLNGAVQKFLPLGALRNFPVPPYDETKESPVKVLSTIDAKIDCNKRIIAELESMTKMLHDYWFVQFDFPDANGKPYKTSGGGMEFNDVLKCNVPEGWEVHSLSKWIANSKTGDWGKDGPEGNYLLRVACLRGTDLNGLNGVGVINAPTRYILNKNTSKLLSPYEFVIEISGGSPTQSTGRIASIIPETLTRFSDPIICSNFCKAISLDDNSYYFNFVQQWNSAYENGVLFGWEGKTSGIKNLLFDAFTSKYFVPTPPKYLAEKFFNIALPIESKKQLLGQENDSLAALRDCLLPLVMNGQVTVS